jgi:lysophospholipase L1-like esterase
MLRLTTIIFSLVALAAGALLGVVLLRYPVSEFDHLQMAVYLGAPAMTAVVALACLKLSAENRLLAIITGISAIVAVYAAEIWIAMAPPEDIRFDQSRPIDPRSKLDVLADLRAEGREAYPAIHPHFFMPRSTSAHGAFRVTSNDKDILPLGSIAHVYNVHCQESGDWVVYRSDRHGFNNPDEVWEQATTLAAVGDSYTNGFCVQPGQDMTSVMRPAFPGALNLGASGNGPLLMLAGIREYLVERRPQTVIWFFFDGNDLQELTVEMHHPVLQKYLEPGFRQDIESYRDEIDRQLKQQALEREAAERREFWERIPLLRNLRQRLLAPPQYYQPPQDADLTDFLEVISMARDEVSAWGGRLEFVYLPNWQTLHGERPGEKERVIKAVRAQGIATHDATDWLAAAGEWKNVFWDPTSHYNAEGYRLVAEGLAASLMKNGARQ